MEDGASEKFNCPICFEIPEKEIYQCINGHMVCFDCGETLSQCPQCRVKMGSPKIRCRPLEDLLDMMRFDCSNKPLGCTTKLKRCQVQNHLKSCTYGVKTITLCKELGFSCDFAIDTKSLKQAVTHLKTSHDFITRETSHVHINLHDFDSANTGENRSYVPVVVDMTKEANKLFVLLSLISKADHTLSFVCLEIGENSAKDVASEFISHYFIHTTNSSKKPHLIWSTNPLGAKHFATEINEPMHKFSISALQQNYTQSNVLAIKCSIQRNVKSKETEQATHTTIDCPINICKTSKNENSMNPLLRFQKLWLENSENDHAPSAPPFAGASAGIAAAVSNRDIFVERPNQILELARRCNVSQRQLKQMKADITAANERKTTMALSAISSGKSRDWLELLVCLGVNWKNRDIQEQTVLHWAVFSGNLEAVNYFLELGADINAMNVWGGTPIREIGYCNNSSRGIKILHVLVSNGANINAIDNDGLSVLQLAKSLNQSNDVIKEIKKLGGR